MSHIASFALAAATAIIPICAASQELTLGAGYTDYPDGGSDSAIFDLGYRHTPFFEHGAFSAALSAAASVTAEGDLYGGVGIGLRWDIAPKWFVDFSLLPGFHVEGPAGNDLGSAIEFRSALGIGHRFENGSALSLAITHTSNASIDDRNPGAESLILRYHLPL